MSVLKGRPEKMWALSGRKWEAWIPKVCRRLACSMTFLPQSSPETAPATLPKLKEAQAGTGRMKNHQL